MNRKISQVQSYGFKGSGFNGYKRGILHTILVKSGSRDKPH